VTYCSIEQSLGVGKRGVKFAVQRKRASELAAYGGVRTAGLKSLSRPLVFLSHRQFLTKENDEEDRERWAERL